MKDYNPFIGFGALLVVMLLFAATEIAPVRAGGEDTKALLAAREDVWHAWFANDQAKLRALLPADTIAINAAMEGWQNRDEVLADAEKSAKDGNKLVSLEFPQVKIQRYGDVAFIYSSYRMTIEGKQGRTESSGRATEVFLLKDGKWTNPGWHMDSGK